jgi:hypothetical protein
MNRRSILRLETLEDRLTPAVKVAAPILQPATVNHTTTQPALVSPTGGNISVRVAIAIQLGGGGSGGSGGGSGSGGTSGGHGGPAGP